MSRQTASIVLLLLWAWVSSAQTTGSIEGVVRDPSEAAVPGAAVRVLAADTGSQRLARTDAEGRFAVHALAPGEYEIGVEHSGFRPLLRRGIDLSAGRSLRLELALTLGEQREEVVVTGEAPLVSPNVADWSARVDAEQLSELPLNGRDLFELSAQQLGATIPVTADRGLTSGLGLWISVNGSRPNMNSFQLDGIYLNDATSTVPASAAGVLLGVEAVREINIVGNPYSAEYGRTAGAVFAAVSKSGGNSLHGSAYEFLRNSSLDAKNFFDGPTEAIPPLRRNQFGGLLSGPLHRDKVFFLVNYEAIRETLGSTVRPAVPDVDARQGILSGGEGGLRQIRVAPEVQPYLDLYPLPNGRSFGDGTAEFVNESIRDTQEDHVVGKVDVLLSDALRFSTRYTFDDGESARPDPMRIWEFALETRYQFVHTDLQVIHSPATISNFRAAFSRVRSAETSSIPQGFSSELAFVPGLPLGSIEVTGLGDLGGIRARLRPRQFVTNNYQFNSDLIHTTANHTLHFGAGFDRIQFNQIADLSRVGRYTFSSLEDFLLANARLGEVMDPTSDTVRGWRLNQFYGYLQDEWRLSPRLSFSWGVRYEAATTPSEVNGKQATLRDPLRDTEVQTGGPLFRNPSFDNFAPRAAFAFDPLGDGKTVIRAGAGVFFDLLGTRELVVAGVRVPPFFRRILVFRPSFPDILGSAAGRSPSASPDGLDFDLPQPYVARWQFSIERQILRASAVRLNYSGARGIHLPGQVGNVNPTAPEVLDDGRLFFPSSGPLLNPAFPNIGMRRTQFNSFYQAFSAGFESRLGSALRYQAKYTFSKSIDETSSTVFTDFASSDLLPTMLDYRANRGLSDFDIRHVFAVNFSWRLPQPETGLARQVLGGWEIHGLAQVQSGNPFVPTVGFDRARLRPAFGDLGQRPNLLGPSGGSAILGDPEKYFDPLAFGLPEAGFYGDLGRGTLIGPGLANFDLALHKALWQSTRHTVNFRAEFFNVANRPNLHIPAGRALFNSREGRVGSAGRITRTATASRQIQLALKWQF